MKEVLSSCNFTEKVLLCFVSSLILLFHCNLVYLKVLMHHLLLKTMVSCSLIIFKLIHSGSLQYFPSLSIFTMLSVEIHKVCYIFTESLSQI